MVLWPRKLSQKWPREPWQRTFLEFSRGSVAAEAIAEVAAGALAAHFSRVFTWFCGRRSYRRSGRGSSGSAFFYSFHVVLWPRRLSEKWPWEPWQRTFLEFSRGSVAGEAIAQMAMENAHSESKMKHFLAPCRKIDFLRFSLSCPSKSLRRP